MTYKCNIQGRARLRLLTRIDSAVRTPERVIQDASVEFDTIMLEAERLIREMEMTLDVKSERDKLINGSK